MPGRSRSVGSVLLITSKLDNAAMGLERGAVLHLCRCALHHGVLRHGRATLEITYAPPLPMSILEGFGMEGR